MMNMITNPWRLMAAAGLLLGLTLRLTAAEPAGEPQPPAKPKFVIVLGEKAADPEKFAAEFLAERLRRDLGAEAAIGAAAPAGGGVQAIILGTPESNPALGKFKADLPKDASEGFLITTDGGATVLVGASPRAVVYAAARLLAERGWRFCSLHDLGEVPVDAKTPMPAGPIKDWPAVRDRALAADALGEVAGRCLDWMATAGFNRLIVLVDRTGVEPAVAVAKEVARRGIDLELSAPEVWWRAQAGIKGGEKPEEAAALIADAQKKLAERIPGTKVCTVEAAGGAQLRTSLLGNPFAGPRGVLGRIGFSLMRPGEPPTSVALLCPPRRFFFDESNIAADYFALSAWKGRPPPVEDFVKDYCRRYYGGGEAGDAIADYFLGLEAMDAELAAPNPLLSEGTYAKWKGLVEKYRGAREKSKANSAPRKRIAIHHRAVLDHYQSCADAARLLKGAEAAEGAEKRRLLLEAVKMAWDYNRRKETRLFDLNPGDAYGFRDASGRSPELEGELVQLEKARALLLAGEDGKIPPGLVAAALAEGGGGKAAAAPLAPEVGGNLAAGFADGKRETAAVLSPGPGGRFVVDFGKEVTVARVRFLGALERPVTQFKLTALDGSGAATVLAEGAAEAPGMFLVQELAFPPAKARTLVFEAERYESARQDPYGPALAELEAYEK
jgi:hypothetical protein